MLNQEIIQTTSLVLTALTSIVLLLTLFEMKSQRKSLYQPDLLIDNQYFNIDLKKDSNLSWTQKGNKDKAFKLIINNVGYGLAKNIRVSWNYDLKQFIKFIKLLDKDNLLEFSKNLSFLHIKDSKNDIAINLRCKHDFNSFLKKDKAFSISMPASYEYLWEVALSYFSNEKGDLGRYFKAFPKAKLIIKYNDSGGSEIIKKYILIPDINSIKNNDFFSGMFRIICSK